MDSAYFISLDNQDGTQRQVSVIQETLGSVDTDEALRNTFKLNEGIEELGTITFNEDYSQWEYDGTLNSDDQKEIAGAIQRRYTSEENDDLTDSEGFTFMWAQNEETIVVKVVPNEGHYGVKINGEYIGDIEQDDETKAWSMANYELDTELVQEIGRKIEENATNI